MGIEIKSFNYMQLAGQIAQGPKWPGKDESALTPKEYVDRRLVELHMLATSPDHQILAAIMEQEIAWHIQYALGKNEPIEPTLYALRACKPFHSPIANSLSHEKIQSFRDVLPGSSAFDKWDENQQHYARQMLTSGKTKLTVTPKNVTLSTGFENIDHAIRSYSFSIAKYFYAIHVAPDCFPRQIENSVRHAAGVEQVKNSAISKTVRKTIAEHVQSGDFPEYLDANQALQNNLSKLGDWIKPRDTQLAAAYAKAKRDVSWLEQYAPATMILSKMTENLAQKGFHQKWGGSFPKMILDLCDHLKETHRELATTALYELATAMASAKVLESEGAKESIERIAHMANKLIAGDEAPIKGVMAMKLIGHKLGLETSQDVSNFIKDNKLSNLMEPAMEKLYPNAIDRAKVFQSFGLRSDSPAMLKAKGRALMDDLGM